MAKTRVTPTDEEALFEHDQISAEEEAQAEVGSLFSIQGDQFANVNWSIHRYRTRAEMHDDPAGEKTEWVADVSGELRGADLIAQIGGGTFNFYGYVPQGENQRRVKLAYRRLIRLAGPRKDFSYVPPPPVASSPGANGTTGSDRLDRLERAIEKLAERPAPATPTPTLTEMVNTLVALDTLRGRGAPSTSPDMAVVSTMMGLYSKGVEDGREREPIPAGEGGTAETVLKIFEAAAPVISAWVGRRPINPPPPRPSAPPPGATATGPTPTTPPAPHEPSSATVVDEREPTLAEQMSGARMLVMVEQLVDAIANNDPVDETADTIERIMGNDLAPILNLPDQAMVGELASRFGASYPELTSPVGQTYVVQVLGKLREPEDAAQPPA